MDGVADKFVELLDLGKSREEQMRIYSTLRCYKSLNTADQEYIRDLCAAVGGAYYGMGLFKFLVTDITLLGAVTKYCVPEGRLRIMRREVYRRWEK